MSQTDSHEPSQGELSGEVTNRLLMDMPQSPRRAQNRALTLFGVFIFLVVLAGIGVGAYMFLTPEESGIVRLTNVSYRQFGRVISKDEIDPRGASAIYYERVPAPEGAEGYDLWMKMTIPKNSYEAMLRRHRTEFQKLESQGVKVTSKSSSRVEIPTDWQQGDADNPLWWDEIKNVRSPDARSSTWEMTAGGIRSGTFWAYDPDSENLYIWEWKAPADRVDSGGSSSDTDTQDDPNPDSDANPDEGADAASDSPAADE